MKIIFGKNSKKEIGNFIRELKAEDKKFYIKKNYDQYHFLKNETIIFNNNKTKNKNEN